MRKLWRAIVEWWRTPNFVIEIEVNGRRHRFKARGPQGGFRLSVRQRSEGEYSTESEWTMGGYADRNGQLTLTVGHGRFAEQDATYFKQQTQR